MIAHLDDASVFDGCGFEEFGFGESLAEVFDLFLDFLRGNTHASDLFQVALGKIEAHADNKLSVFADDGGFEVDGGLHSLALFEADGVAAFAIAVELVALVDAVITGLVLGGDVEDCWCFEDGVEAAFGVSETLSADVAAVDVDFDKNVFYGLFGGLIDYCNLNIAVGVFVASVEKEC